VLGKGSERVCMLGGKYRGEEYIYIIIYIYIYIYIYIMR